MVWSSKSIKKGGGVCTCICSQPKCRRLVTIDQEINWCLHVEKTEFMNNYGQWVCWTHINTYIDSPPCFHIESREKRSQFDQISAFLAEWQPADRERSGARARFTGQWTGNRPKERSAHARTYENENEAMLICQYKTSIPKKKEYQRPVSDNTHSGF